MRLSTLLCGALLWLGASVGAADELQVGDAAPDFELRASDGKTYRLSDFRDRQAVVVAWYPKAFTGGCTIECKSFAEKGDLIREYDVAFFMASVDPLAENRSFAREMRADFPILSDPARTVAESYGVLNRFRVASRWTFYIGADGTILAIDRNVQPRTSAEDVATKLGELGVSRREDPSS